MKMSGLRHGSDRRRHIDSAGPPPSDGFADVLEACGVRVRPGLPDTLLSGRNGASVYAFCRALGQRLGSDANDPAVARFLEGLELHLQSAACLRISLQPMALEPQQQQQQITTTTFTPNDSLLRALLGVDLVQMPVANLLLEKVSELALEQDSMSQAVMGPSGGGGSGGGGGGGGGITNIPKLALNTLRWLPHVVDARALAQSMIDMTQVVPEEVQREIITALPEVIDDRGADEAAVQLRQLACAAPRLTVPVLDACANLAISESQLADMQEEVLGALASYPADTLPVAIRFLLQGAAPKSAPALVARIRDGIDFDSINSGGKDDEGSRGRDGVATVGGVVGAESADETLCLEAIRTSMRFQKSVADAWIKVLSGIASPATHGSLDFFVLLQLGGIDTHRKAATALLGRHVRAGFFPVSLVDALFAGHRAGLRSMLSAVLALAESLLHDRKGIAAVAFARALYMGCFRHFDDYCRQEVVGALITHIGSGSVGEADAALLVLQQLAAEMTREMQPFAAFIKGIFDYVERLRSAHVRALFSVLTALTSLDGGEELLADDVHILLRKMLASAALPTKRLGIVAASSVVGALVGPHAHRTAIADADIGGTAVRLLDMVHDNIRRHPALQAIFCDEMTRYLHPGLNPTVDDWVADRLAIEFQDLFVSEVSQEPQPEQYHSLKLTLGLPVPGGSGGVVDVSLTIVPAMMCKRGPGVGQLACPSFRLLQMQTKLQCKGDLAEIDALLFAQTWIFAPSVVDKFPSLRPADQDMVCAGLLVCVNWLRELLNAFAKQRDPDVRLAVLARLTQLRNTEQTLAACWGINSSFVAPLAYCDEVAPAQSGESSRAKTMSKTKRKAVAGVTAKSGAALISKRKKKGSAATSTAISKKKKRATTGEEAEKENDGPPSTGSQSIMSSMPASAPAIPFEAPCGLNHHQCRLALREIDLDVFELLRYRLISDVLDTEQNTVTSQRKHIQLERADLSFLLSDLSRKLRRVFHAPKAVPWDTQNSSDAGFEGVLRHDPAEVMGVFLGLLPSLCDHLESACSFFRGIFDEFDGIRDVAIVSKVPGHELADQCLRQLLNILSSVISWPAFAEPSDSSGELLAQLLQVLASRAAGADASASQGSAPGPMLRAAFQYLEGLGSAMATSETFVAHLRLLADVCTLMEARDQSCAPVCRESTARLAKDGLAPCWSGNTRQPIKAAELTVLLDMYLGMVGSSASPATVSLQALEDLALGVVPSMLEDAVAAQASSSSGNSAKKSTTFASDSMRTMTKTTFPVYYRTMLAATARAMAVAGVDSASGANLADALVGKPGALSLLPDPTTAIASRLADLSALVRVFFSLVKLTKVEMVRSKALVLATVKTSRRAVESFVRHCMPLLEACLKSHTTTVIAVIKDVQKSTRVLQNLCSHSKVSQDLTLTSQVPPLKRCLESLVVRAKTMLAANNCVSAISIGTLKHRDIDGETVSSQAYNPPAESEEEIEEEETYSLSPSPGEDMERFDDGIQEVEDDVGGSDAEEATEGLQEAAEGMQEASEVEEEEEDGEEGSGGLQQEYLGASTYLDSGAESGPGAVESEEEEEQGTGSGSLYSD